MKVRKIDIIVVSVIVGLIALFILALWINLRIYVDESKLKITDDISTSDSTLLQNEFGISLPRKAEISAFGYSSDLIVIRVEGVEDLPAFLTDSIHLELDEKKTKTMTDNIFYSLRHDSSPEADMYGTTHKACILLNSNYQTNPIDYSTTTSFFLLDGKLIIEISKTHTTAENRKAIKEIVGA